MSMITTTECPVCNSPKISHGSIVVGQGVPYVDLNCRACESEWRNHYDMEVRSTTVSKNGLIPDLPKRLRVGMAALLNASGISNAEALVILKAATKWEAQGGEEYMDAPSTVLNAADMLDAVREITKEADLDLVTLLVDLQPVLDQLVNTCQDQTSLESVYNDHLPPNNLNYRTDWEDVALLLDRVADVTKVASSIPRPKANA
jgi:hypothetical protein